MIKDFIRFCKEKISFWGIGIVVVLSYGLLISRVAIGIDNESANYYFNEGLIAQDRIGWYIVNRIFPSYEYMPLWQNIIGIILIILGYLLVLYCIENKTKYNFPKSVLTISCAVFASFPYIAKSAIFHGSMIQFGYVLCFAAVALYFSCDLLEKLTLGKVTPIFLCILLIFLFEKAYIVLFCQELMFFLLLKRMNDKECTFKKIARLGLCIICIIIVTYVSSRIIITGVHIYKGITPSGYTNNFIKYDFSGASAFFSSFGSFIKNYCYNMYAKFGGDCAHNVFIISVMTIIIIGVYKAISHKDVLIVVLVLANVFLAQSIHFAVGDAAVATRVFSFNWALFAGSVVIYISILTKESWRKYLFYVIYLYIIGIQGKEMEKVYYAKYNNYENDKELAIHVINEIEKQCGMIATYNKPIIFMGFPNNIAASLGEVEDTSMFVWDRYGSTRYEETSERIYRFYNMLGYDIQSPENNFDYTNVRSELDEMESFPQEGFVKEVEDYIIVKLGDSLCEEINIDSRNKSNDKLKGNVDVFSFDNGRLYMQGWLIETGKNSYNNNLSLVIVDESKSYKMRVDEISGVDVTEYFSDGMNYDNSRYFIALSIPEIVESGEYDVFIELDNGVEKYLFDTEKKISW